jgi:hypothetical protein
MALERPLDLSIVKAWLAAWNEADLYSDPAVRHLAALIDDPKCLVVVTRGVGREARSLVFRCWRPVRPNPPDCSAVVSPSARHTGEIPPLFHGPVPPAAPVIGQLWRQVRTECSNVDLRTVLEKMFRWDGSDWIVLRVQPCIVKQGKEPCGFMEALVYAHEMAKWGSEEEVIYTYDDSAWGNA